MLTIRSIIFTALLFVSAILASTLIVLVFWAPASVPRAITVGWSRMMVRAGGLLCGLKVVVEDRENIPDSPSVIMIKHTTALEAYWQIAEFPHSAWVVKRELSWVPPLGWALKFGLAAIVIDRGAGGSAVKQVIEQGVARLADDVWVTIFPEGTRGPVTASVARHWRKPPAASSCRLPITRATSGRGAACANNPAPYASVLGRRLTLRSSHRRKQPGSCRTGSKRRCSTSAPSTRRSNCLAMTRPHDRIRRLCPLPTTGSIDRCHKKGPRKRGPFLIFLLALPDLHALIGRQIQRVAFDNIKRLIEFRDVSDRAIRTIHRW